MNNDLSSSYARLERLKELVEMARQMPHQDQARLSRTLLLVSRALQTIARVRLQIGDPEQMRQAVELETLCWEVERTALLYEMRSKFNGSRK